MSTFNLADLAAINTNFRRVDGGGSQLVQHIYAIDTIDFYILRDQLGGEKECKLHVFETEHLRAGFLECDGATSLIISASDGGILNDPDVFNQSIAVVVNDQIRIEGSKIGNPLLSQCDHDTFCSICVAYVWSVALLNGMQINDAFSVQAQNSFKHLLKNHKTIVKEKPFAATKHLEYFSWIYYVELRAIAEIFGKGSHLRIHDVATNSGHLPMLINSLDDELLFGVHYDVIGCSDLFPDYAERSMENIQASLHGIKNNIQLVKMDLTEDNKLLEDFDVIVANDILEHFPEDQSFDVLKLLWRRTRSVLLIHVPFESEPTEAYGHLTSFNKEKLTHWASQLDNCENITEQYSYVAEESFDSNFIDNCLFLKRTQ